MIQEILSVPLYDSGSEVADGGFGEDDGRGLQRGKAGRCPPDWQRDAHNQDYVWFLGAEMQAIVPADAAVGDVFFMPEIVTQRLIRYHMLDCVRGETPPWPASALRDIELKLRVTDASADRVKMRVSGHALLHEEGDWCVHPPSSSAYRIGEMCCLIRERGFDATLLGYLCFDRRAQAFSRFDLVAVGTRWGGHGLQRPSRRCRPSTDGNCNNASRSHSARSHRTAYQPYA